MNTRRSFILLAVLALIIPLGAVLGRQRPALAQATPQASPVVNTDVSGTIAVAMVANPQMVALQENIDAFNEVYPNVTVNLTVLPENEVRQVITNDVTQQSGQFDVVTVGTFEVPLWGAQGWLEEVGDDVAADPAYN